MAGKDLFAHDYFERLFDRMFDEFLTGRWRLERSPTESTPGQVTEYHDRFEVRIEMAGALARRIEVEVVGQRLLIRWPQGRADSRLRSYSFARPFESELVTARYTDGMLIVVLPKEKGRRIRLMEPDRPANRGSEEAADE